MLERVMGANTGTHGPIYVHGTTESKQTHIEGDILEAQSCIHTTKS